VLDSFGTERARRTFPLPTRELSPLEIWQLRELTRSGNGRVVLRALRVLWRAEGLTTLEIGERLDCPPDTVTLWLERYRALGLTGLLDAPRSGRPPQLDAPDREQWAVCGSLNVRTGSFHWQAYLQAVSARFLLFRDYLREAYPTGEILWVVDHARYPTSKVVVAWLKQHPRLLLLYLPARRSDLHPGERSWKRLKNAVAANRSFADRFTWGKFVRRHFQALSPADFLAQAGVRNDFCDAT